VRIIAKSRLMALATAHGDCVQQVAAWYAIASKATWRNLSEVRQTFRHADAVGGDMLPIPEGKGLLGSTPQASPRVPEGPARPIEGVVRRKGCPVGRSGQLYEPCTNLFSCSLSETVMQGECSSPAGDPAFLPMAEGQGSSAGFSDNTIFDIKGNDYRLIVHIRYEVGIIYIKNLLTHAEYDKGAWNV
jgi:mRNA-degrading endonuclease HigB of HigAB toxin-antitoxin module